MQDSESSVVNMCERELQCLLASGEPGKDTDFSSSM